MKQFLLITSIGFVCMSANLFPVEQKRNIDLEKLNGYWELNYVSGIDKSLPELFHDKIPVLNISITDKKIVGFSGCNSFFSNLAVDSVNFSFKKGMGRSFMACAGKGEPVFWRAIGKVNKHSIPDDTTLNLLAGDIALMRYSKRDSVPKKQTQK